MSVTIDCGDFQLTMKITVGASYPMPPHSEDEAQERIVRGGRVLHIVNEIEEGVAQRIAVLLGLDPDERNARIQARERANADAREAEEQGRAAKNAQRAGLPEPEPGKRGENVKPGQPLHEPGPTEQDFDDATKHLT